MYDLKGAPDTILTVLRDLAKIEGLEGEDAERWVLQALVAAYDEVSLGLEDDEDEDLEDDSWMDDDDEDEDDFDDDDWDDEDLEDEDDF